MVTSNTASDRQLPIWIGLSTLFHLALGIAVWHGGHWVSSPPEQLEVEWVFLSSPPEQNTSRAGDETTPGPEPAARRVAALPSRRGSRRVVPRILPVATPAPAANRSSPAIPATPATERKASVPDIFPDRWEVAPGEATGATIGGPATGDGAGPGSPGESEGWGDGTGRGTGLVPIPVVERRIEDDGKRIVAQDRVARGLVSPEVNSVSTRMEAAWKVTRQDVRRWPVRPETRVEYFTPEGTDDQVTGASCTYQRYSLAQVRVVVDQDGALISATIVRSSGSRRWNREALDLVRQAAPFPPPPAHERDASGRVSSVWDIGVRDYSRSSCFFFHKNRLVKDIVLVGVY